MHKRLIDTFDEGLEPINDGIFHRIEALKGESLSWFTFETAISCDQEYYYNHSGDKRITPLFDKLLEKQATGRLINALDTLANIILRKYADKWQRLYVAMVETEYNPVENYNGVETEKIASKIEVQSDTNSNMYAFNSQSASPVAESGALQTTKGNADDNVRTLEKHGNIGVTSNQDMLNQEIELRDSFNLYETMYKDVDEVLTLSIY